MKSLPRLTALFGFALLSAACGSDKEIISLDAYILAFAEDACTAVVACECEYPNGVAYDHCVGELTVNGESFAELNKVDGLSFDGDCGQAYIDQVNALGCGVPSGDENAACEQPCKVWYGPMGKGASCTYINGIDNCAQGLTCEGDVCVDPCAEPNLPSLNELCSPYFGCEEGLYCDDETDPLAPTCTGLPDDGQPCVISENFGYLCDEGLACDQSGAVPTCIGLPNLGEECPSFQCEEGLYCDTEQATPICAGLPTLGQDCLFGGCAQPYQCDDDGICVEPDPAVCVVYDGLPDLGEDEGTDTDPGLCGGDEFECVVDETCIPLEWLCDGGADCSDASDELDCP